MNSVLMNNTCQKQFIRPLYYRHTISLRVPCKNNTSLLVSKAMIDNNILNSLNDFSNDAHIVAKSIILYTLFYCTLNWMHYKRIREESEKKNKK